MTVAVHAELTGDGQRIALLAAGPAEDVAHLAKLLHTTTPAYKPSEPKGALLTAATWPAAVQLAAVFGDRLRPGPALAAWLGEQVAARTTALPDTLDVPLPDGLVPRPYQVAGARLIAATGRALIFDEPRTGKTWTTILGLAQLRVAEDGPVLVVCPASVVDPWVDTFRLLLPHWTAVAWRGTPAKRRALIDTADVYVASYDTARIDAPDTNPTRSPLVALDPRALVVDECLPAGVPVETPTGPRPIESLRPGDEVIGVDHATGQPTVTNVRHVFRRRTTSALVEVRGVAMTANHPVWTARGYVPAGTVAPTDEVAAIGLNFYRGDLHADVRVVRAGVHEDWEAERPTAVLQQGVLGEVAHVATGVRRVARHPEASGSGICQYATLAEQSGGSGNPTQVPAQRPEPLPRSGSASESAGCASGERVSGADRRQWYRLDRAAEATGRPIGVADRVRDRDWAQGTVPACVQGRPGLADANDRDRGRRQLAPQPGSKGARREEGQPVARAGLDGAAFHQRPGPERDGRCDGRDPHRDVFNIETGTGNYVAGGLLVHNCHMIKTAQAARTKAVQRLARNAKVFVALSGTPITHHPADLWPTLTCLAPGAWPSRERWVRRYCLTAPGDYDETILGLSPATEPEFRLTLLGQHRRVARADVLDQLPPKVYSVRTVTLPPEWRKAYDAMEADMLAELPDGGQISVMGVLAQLTRLSQLASAPADVKTTFEDAGDGTQREHTEVTLRGPSWKVAALLEVLDERPGEKVVVFAHSKQLIRLAGDAATKAGHRVGWIVGGQPMAERTATIRDFQTGGLNLICATTGAGGTGITLSAAGTLVFLQRPWSLVESLQAEDRAEGDPAASRGTEIIDIVAADTVDTRVRAVLREKAGQLADLVQDPRVVAELLGGASVTRIRKKAS